MPAGHAGTLGSVVIFRLGQERRTGPDGVRTCDSLHGPTTTTERAVTRRSLRGKDRHEPAVCGQTLRQKGSVATVTSSRGHICGCPYLYPPCLLLPVSRTS